MTGTNLTENRGCHGMSNGSWETRRVTAKRNNKSIEWVEASGKDLRYQRDKQKPYIK